MKAKSPKLILFLFACVVLVFLLATTGTGEKPFSGLTAQAITAASVTLTPPGTSFAVAQDELPRLAELLRGVVFYRVDKNAQPLVGQGSVLQLTMADGTQTTLALDAGTTATLDGVSHRVSQKAHKALMAFYNTMRALQEGT